MKIALQRSERIPQHTRYHDGAPVTAPGYRHPKGDGDRHHWSRRRSRERRQARRVKATARHPSRQIEGAAISAWLPRVRLPALPDGWRVRRAPWWCKTFLVLERRDLYGIWQHAAYVDTEHEAHAIARRCS